MNNNSGNSLLMCQLPLFFSLFIFLVIVSGCKDIKQIYVSARGDDQGNGTKEAPYASVFIAKEAIRQLKQNGYNGAIELILNEGIYYLDKPLIFTADESGTAQNPYTIRAAVGQQVILSGGMPLKLSWEKYTDRIWKAAVPDGLAFESLFANGQQLIRARFPNYDAKILPFNGYSADAISSDRLRKWKNPEGGYVHALHQGRWGGFHYRISGKKANGDLNLVGGTQNNRPSAMHERYRYVENIFEELDSAGEWFLDTAQHLLYYYPADGQDLNGLDFIAARLENLITLQGSEEQPIHDIRIEGIHFTQTGPTFMKTAEPLLRSDWTIYRQGALTLEGAERCKIENNDFYDIGGNAIFVSNYNRAIEIKGNLIERVGGGGINLVGSPGAVRSPSFSYEEFVPLSEMDTIPGPKNRQYPAFCLVADNLIRKIGQIEKQVAGVHVSMASDIRIEHNTIYDVPRAGINIGDGTWGGHELAYNDVFNTVLETSDHGAFNAWGRDRFWHPDRAVMDTIVAKHPTWVKLDAVKTTQIYNNRFRCDHGWDIDLDDGSTNYAIYNNLCLNGGLKLREGFYRKVYNNILLNNGFHPHVWFQNSHDVFVRNIVMTAHQQIGIKYWGDTVDYNLFSTEAAWKESRQYGIEQRGVFAEPGFENVTAGNFKLTNSGQFVKNGFVEFDMDHFGVTTERLKQMASQPEMPLIEVANAISAGSLISWRGFKVKNIETLEEQSAAGLNNKKGILVLELETVNEVHLAGVRVGDVIQGVNHEETNVVADLLREENRLRGKPVKLQLWRNQHALEVAVKF